MKILALTRAPQFSPNSVEKDAAIMAAVVDRLRLQGNEVIVMVETACATTEPNVDLCLSMGRLPSTCQWLKANGVRTINSPEGVQNCDRQTLERLMREHNIPAAPREGSGGYWLKRSPYVMEPHDIVFCPDRKSLDSGLKDFVQRGIGSYTITAHVEGDLVKFYGVQGTDFFRYYYPADDGQGKFGSESVNSPAHHYQFELDALSTAAGRLAEVADVCVYGGDAIVKADGTFCLIDFNDWPSFSRCREEAADAIVSIINEV